MLIDLHKSKQGEYILRFNVPKVQKHLLLGVLVAGINSLLGFFLRHYYTMLVGFGLGIGISMGLVVGQSPLGAQAESFVISSTQGVKPSQVQLTDQKEIKSQPISSLTDIRHLQWIISDQVFHYTQSAQLHELGPIILAIGLQSDIHATAKQLALGDIVSLVGDNNGIYSYGVVQIRRLNFESAMQLNQFKENDSALVVLLKDSLVDGDFTAIILQRQF